MAEFTVVVKRIENRKAVLELGHGHNIVLPLKLLPINIKENDTIILETLSEAQHEARRQNIAKALLEEILGSEEASGKKND
ncbi:unnamed protein product [marine sediment metagenome]|uniref:DUF3006 domain-containing protein n=1 Tax=marine sediment metagenome TaxID=412755 RepID=X0U6A5_9ZZZZ